MNKDVCIEPSLLKGKELRVAHFIKGVESCWVLQSASPKTNNIDDYEKQIRKMSCKYLLN